MADNFYDYKDNNDHKKSQHNNTLKILRGTRKSCHLQEQILEQQTELLNIFKDVAAAIKENTEETRALRKELSPRRLNKKKKPLIQTN